MASEPTNVVNVEGVGVEIPWHAWFHGWKNVPTSIRAREQRLLDRFNTARRLKRKRELARRKAPRWTAEEIERAKVAGEKFRDVFGPDGETAEARRRKRGDGR